jgi:predicted nuclease with TOPRIM domain
MAADERARHHLLVKLQEVLGEKDAATLMEHLPPDRWHELATKRDLAHQLEEVDRRFQQVEHRFQEVDRRFAQVDRRFEQVDRRFEQVDRRFAQVDHRFDLLELRFDALTTHLDERFEHQHDRLLVVLHERIDRQTRTLLFTVLAAVVTMALVGIVGG